MKEKLKIKSIHLKNALSYKNNCKQNLKIV